MLSPSASLPIARADESGAAVLLSYPAKIAVTGQGPMGRAGTLRIAHCASPLRHESHWPYGDGNFDESQKCRANRDENGGIVQSPEI